MNSEETITENQNPNITEYSTLNTARLFDEVYPINLLAYLCEQPGLSCISKSIRSPCRLELVDRVTGRSLKNMIAEH